MPELQSTASTRHSWFSEGTSRGTQWLIPASDDYAEASFSGVSSIPAGVVIRDVEIVSTDASERITNLQIREHLGTGTILDFTAENIKTLLEGGSRDIALRSSAHANGTITDTQRKWYSASASATIKITYGQSTAHVKYNPGTTSQEWVLCEVYICDDGENWQPCELRRYDGSSWVQCDFT